MSKVLEEKLEKMSAEQQKLWALRHTAEHVLHTAMQNLYPNLKKAMGPATDEGFYFDFDVVDKISEADFPNIEKEMQKLIDADLPMIQELISAEEAKKIFKGNPYKLEWVEDIGKRGEKISIFKMGDKDMDLCSGPHAKSTEEVKAFKLLKIAGAYWHGDEKNKMLTRIYGVAFASQKDLDDYLNMLAEAEKRDHKKLGQQMELFMFHETAPGMPYWLPKGVVFYNELIKFWREEHKKRGYQEIVSPLINKKALYEISGHWEHYLENMFVSETGEGEIYGLKPMNCPNAMIVFGSKTRSYKELPLRLGDVDVIHRYELSGTLNGLLRAREFRQDDAHIFVTEDQIKAEYKEVFEITDLFYSIFDIPYRFRLGTRPEKYMGDVETWNRAEKELKEILEESGKEYFIQEGDGAFYGPKVDILMKDAIGRDWQMGTIQLDFQIPRNFKLTYAAADGSQKTPVVVHRVIYGSLERFIGILIEHLAGNFPTWLAPVQVIVLPIADRHLEYAKEVNLNLTSAGIRSEIDERSEKLGAKIRDAQMQKIPYMIIIGDKEIENKMISVRGRSGKDYGQQPLQEFIKNIKIEIEGKILDKPE